MDLQMILKGHCVVKGIASGNALVADTPISYVGGIDALSGEFIDPDHPLYSMNIKGKILVYPTGKGSTGGSYMLYEAAYNGVGPAAIINNRIEQVTAVGAILADIPTMDHVEPNPVEYIQTGDYIEIDATNGIIHVYRQSNED